MKSDEQKILETAFIRAGQIIFGGFLLAGVLLLARVAAEPAVLLFRSLIVPLLE